MHTYELFESPSAAVMLPCMPDVELALVCSVDHANVPIAIVVVMVVFESRRTCRLRFPFRPKAG